MKKILLLIAMTGVLMGIISCSNDDEPKRGDGVFTVNTPMVNHLYSIHADQALGMAATHNKLVLDTVKHKASLELNYNDGQGDKTLKFNDLSATPKRLGFYVLSSPSDNSFSGYVDINESSIRYRYVTAEGIRVISTTPDVFFLKTHNTVTYDDTTKATVIESSMYQFGIVPSSKTATITVMSIVHAKDNKFFNNIIAKNVPYTVTPNGFTINGSNISTTATYIARYDSSAVIPGVTPSVKTTDEYPFKTFNATIDLANDNLNANYMIGGSATVAATGRTYPDYTSY